MVKYKSYNAYPIITDWGNIAFAIIFSLLLLMVLGMFGLVGSVIYEDQNLSIIGEVLLYLLVGGLASVITYFTAVKFIWGEVIQGAVKTARGDLIWKRDPYFWLRNRYEFKLRNDILTTPEKIEDMIEFLKGREGGFKLFLSKGSLSRIRKTKFRQRRIYDEDNYSFVNVSRGDTVLLLRLRWGEMLEYRGN